MPLFFLSVMFFFVVENTLSEGACVVGETGMSIEMPKNVRAVDGPSVFPQASGTPRMSQVCITVCRLSAHSSESGRPRTTKSSR